MFCFILLRKLDMHENVASERSFQVEEFSTWTSIVPLVRCHSCLTEKRTISRINSVFWFSFQTPKLTLHKTTCRSSVKVAMVVELTWKSRENNLRVKQSIFKTLSFCVHFMIVKISGFLDVRSMTEKEKMKSYLVESLSTRWTLKKNCLVLQFFSMEKTMKKTVQVFGSFFPWKKPPVFVSFFELSTSHMEKP